MDVKRAMTKREAIRVVLEIDPETVIDDNWWEYFMENMRKLVALLVLFNCESYKELLERYEGEIIDDLIEDLSLKHTHEV